MSGKFSNEELKMALNELDDQQSIKGVIIGSLIGLIPAGGLFYLFGEMGGILVWLLFSPAAIIGWQAAYLGRAYKFKYRIVPGIFALVLHLGVTFFVFEMNPIMLLTAPLSFGVAAYFGKRKLTSIYETAIWKNELGKLS